MNKFTCFSLMLLASLAACDYDNYPAPDAELTGRVVYEGEPIGVRQNAIQIELWQDGFDVRREIPVHVHQDGTFAARLFDGVYKLVLKDGSGPWRDRPDTIQVTLTRAESVDVPVEPYFVIDDESISLNGTTLTATFNVNRVVDGSVLEHVGLYVGATQFVDSRFSDLRVEQPANVEDGSASFTLTLDVGSALANRDELFARVAVKTAGVEEMLYTPVASLARP